MGFSFKQRKDVADQVRKIAAEQARTALEDTRGDASFDETVHVLRRHCKKMRGLLRIIRPNFPDFERENAAFRDAADSLSAERDAAVMVETFDLAMKKEWAGSIARERRRQFRSELQANRKQIGAQVDREQLLEDFRASMDAAITRIKDWSFKDDQFDLIAPGLHDTYARMRKRMAKAAKSGDPIDFHDWRKDVKGHGFHVGLLKKAAPDVFGARKEHLGTLGDLLGDHHNLVVLRQTIGDVSGPVGRTLDDGLVGMQRKLEAKALDLGRQLAIESPGKLTKRFEKTWALLPKEA